MRMELVKIIRERLGWSYGQLAAKLGVTVTSAQNLELKGAFYRPDWLISLFDASGMRADDFIALLRKDAQKPKKKRIDAGTFRPPRRL